MRCRPYKTNLHCQPIHNYIIHPIFNDGSNQPKVIPVFLFPQLNSGSIIVHPQIFQILPCKDSFLPCRRQGSPYGLAEKNHPHFVPVFFLPSLALDKAKNWRGHVRNRNTALQGAGHVKFKSIKNHEKKPVLERISGVRIGKRMCLFQKKYAGKTFKSAG